MDWDLAIDNKRTALLRLVTALFEAWGRVPGKPSMLPRFIHGSVLHVLRPAEAAGRRLVFVLAQRIVVTLGPKRAGLKRTGPTQPIPRGEGSDRAPVFALYDPRKRFDLGLPKRPRYAKHGPQITVIGVDEWTPIPAVEKKVFDKDAPVDGSHLRKRVEALKAALEDLPKQAQRLARMEARRVLEPAPKKYRTPMRPGLPPGFRKRGRYEIDQVLQECHQLAWWAIKSPDTS